MKKRRQHYVWQNYLKPFCYQEKMVYCLINQQVKGISTKDVAVQKDIYRLKELSKSEAEFLVHLFEAKDINLINDLNRNWIKIFNVVFEIKNDTTIGSNAEIDTKIDDLEQNLSEDLHMSIEDSGFAYLDYLYKEDTSFFLKDDDRAKFLLFLMVQYCRTIKMKEGISGIDGRGHLAFDKAWNIMVFIMATNVGMRIYAEKDQWELIGLRNSTTTPFITSDQPIINLHVKDKPEDNAKLSDDEFELYYPVTPSFAVVLKKKKLSYMEYNNIDEQKISLLNHKIKKESFHHLFSNSYVYLESIKNA